MPRVVAITRGSNIPGQRSLEKFGMRRARAWTTGDGRDLLLYVLDRP